MAADRKVRERKWFTKRFSEIQRQEDLNQPLCIITVIKELQKGRQKQQSANWKSLPANGKKHKTGLYMRVKPGKPKKSHKLCFKTREGPEDWQKRGAFQGRG